jgi:chaperonin GroEL (HSP60 family)
MAITDLAKTTLGPKGMVCPCAVHRIFLLCTKDGSCSNATAFSFKITYYLIYVQDKILQSTGRGRNVTVTNDGATILKSLHIDNPAAKVLVGILFFRSTA